MGENETRAVRFTEKRESMKKVLATGLLAICLIAATQQQASAWVNSRFGVGLNWDYSSGGNSFGWGLARNGQPPGPEGFGGGFGGGHFPQYGMSQPQGFAPMQQNAFDVPMYEPAYAQPSMPYAPQYAPPFQFATYPRPVYYYYGR